MKIIFANGRCAARNGYALSRFVLHEEDDENRDDPGFAYRFYIHIYNAHAIRPYFKSSVKKFPYRFIIPLPAAGTLIENALQIFNIVLKFQVNQYSRNILYPYISVTIWEQGRPL